VASRVADRGVAEDNRLWRLPCGRDGIDKPQPKIIAATQGEGEDGSRVIKARMLLGVLVVLVAFAAGCGSSSDQDGARQEAKEKIEALQMQVDDLKRDVAGLQKKINAHEEKEQQQQINQLKKALKDLKQRVNAQDQQDQK
jgi:outer membrane murein-binding lipoprotein Lpp